MKHDAHHGPGAVRPTRRRVRLAAPVHAAVRRIPDALAIARPAATPGRTNRAQWFARLSRLGLSVVLAGGAGATAAGTHGAGGPAAVAADAPPRGLGGLIGLDPASSLLTVTEGDGNDAIIAVVRGGTTVGAISAGFATLPGSAGAGTDFGIRNGVAMFPSGDGTPRFVVVPIVDDALVEGPEQFTVSLSQPTGGASLGPVTTVTVTILDNDTALPPDLVFGDGFED